MNLSRIADRRRRRRFAPSLTSSSTRTTQHPSDQGRQPISLGWLLYEPTILRLNAGSSNRRTSGGRKMMIPVRTIVFCGFAALGLALSLGTASAQDKTFELKLSHWVPPSHP